MVSNNSYFVHKNVVSLIKANPMRNNHNISKNAPLGMHLPGHLTSPHGLSINTAMVPIMHSDYTIVIAIPF